MEKQNKATSGMLMAAVIAVVAVVGYLTAGKWMKYQAIDNCLTAGRITTNTADESAKYAAVEPIQKWYDTCMKEKGLMKK